MVLLPSFWMFPCLTHAVLPRPAWETSGAETGGMGLCSSHSQTARSLPLLSLLARDGEWPTGWVVHNTELSRPKANRDTVEGGLAGVCPKPGCRLSPGAWATGGLCFGTTQPALLTPEHLGGCLAT